MINLILLCKSYKNKIVFGFEKDDWLYTNGNFEHHFPKRFYEEVKMDKTITFASPKFLIDIPDIETFSYIKYLSDDCILIVTDYFKLEKQ